MLNKPKFMTPSTNLQEYVVDANSNKMPFSFIVDGNEAIKGVKIKIYDLSTNTELLQLDETHDSIKPMFDANGYFYPVDKNNRNNIFAVELPSELTSTDGAQTQKILNRPEPYYWTVDVTGALGSTTTSCEEVFYANTPPNLKIIYGEGEEDSNYLDLTSETILKAKNCYFKATYEQAEGVPLKRYGWKLTDADSGQVLVDTISHNQIYGTANNIICSYDGFLNNGKYSIELYVETQNNAILITEPINFIVQYKTTFLTNDFKVEALSKEPSNILDWADATIISGKSNGVINYKENYPIIDYSSSTPNTSVEIKDNSNITFDYGSTSNLDIPEDSYIVLSTQLLNSNDTAIFVAEGKDIGGNHAIRKLSFSSGSFEYIVSDNDLTITKIYTPQNKPNKYVWYIITMSPILGADGSKTTLIVSENTPVNSLYPSDTLYPSKTLYPSFGIWETAKVGEV